MPAREHRSTGAAEQQLIGGVHGDIEVHLGLDRIGTIRHRRLVALLLEELRAVAIDGHQLAWRRVVHERRVVGVLPERLIRHELGPVAQTIVGHLRHDAEAIGAPPGLDLPERPVVTSHDRLRAEDGSSSKEVRPTSDPASTSSAAWRSVTYSVNRQPLISGPAPSGSLLAGGTGSGSAGAAEATPASRNDAPTTTVDSRRIRLMLVFADVVFMADSPPFDGLVAEHYA